jgi:hypothetical protein
MAEPMGRPLLKDRFWSAFIWVCIALGMGLLVMLATTI